MTLPDSLVTKLIDRRLGDSLLSEPVWAVSAETQAMKDALVELRERLDSLHSKLEHATDLRNSLNTGVIAIVRIDADLQNLTVAVRSIFGANGEAHEYGRYSEELSNFATALDVNPRELQKRFESTLEEVSHIETYYRDLTEKVASKAAQTGVSASDFDTRVGQVTSDAAQVWTDAREKMGKIQRSSANPTADVGGAAATLATVPAAETAIAFLTASMTTGPDLTELAELARTGSKRLANDIDAFNRGHESLKRELDQIDLWLGAPERQLSPGGADALAAIRAEVESAVGSQIPARLFEKQRAMVLDSLALEAAFVCTYGPGSLESLQRGNTEGFTPLQQAHAASVATAAQDAVRIAPSLITPVPALDATTAPTISF